MNRDVSPGLPLLSVVHGVPTEEDLAAVTAVILALSHSESARELPVLPETATWSGGPQGYSSPGAWRAHRPWPGH